MFQSFTAPDYDARGPERAAAIRGAMSKMGVQAFLIPRADAHQGEYVPPRDERLAYATGFTGSAGIAAIAETRAAIFVDGRYTLQAETQVGTQWERNTLGEDQLVAFLADALEAGDAVGFDPWLHGRSEIDALTRRLDPAGVSVASLPGNPIDEIWTDQPPPPGAAIKIHPDDLSGESAAAKRGRIAAKVSEAGAAAVVLTLPDSIAWLFNIRGSDIPRNPVPLVFALLEANGDATLFAEDGQADGALRAHLGEATAIAPRATLADRLAAFQGAKVLLDQRTCPIAVETMVEAAGADVVRGVDPCIGPKAIKNETEIAGSRAAHRRDGAAMARFLCWLEAEAPGGALTEIAIAKRLEEERRATNQLLDISFDTISGAGPDGAIVHYRVTRETDRTLNPGELMLVDSGGQYADGTTDITRTVVVGEPPAGAARAFTLVLKGMIQVSLARFPAGTTGRDLDTLARSALWRAGMDYDHGTGHGIGSYLCVHEGPQSLSRRGHVPLEAGMMCSNEPGYYRSGGFGIRIENLFVVTYPETPEGGDRAMLGSETLTLCPIERRLIEPERLTVEERDWLNAYHARVLDEIGPLVDGATKDWLQAACAPI